MAITAAMVKTLRERTGLPLMDCKNALSEVDGDEDKAIQVLRKKGAAKIEKMAGRETSQGRVACFVDAENRRAGIVELRCESAPVAKTDDFIDLANLMARQAAAAEAPTPESILNAPLLDDPSRTIADALAEVFNRLRENIQLANVARLTGHIGSYVHHDQQKGALVAFSGECPPQLANGVCMHVTAINPKSTRRDEIDAALVEKERAAALESAKGKPENIIDKIVDGKMNKWFGEIVLLEQAYVLDDKKSVGDALKEVSQDLTITGFARFVVGGQ